MIIKPNKINIIIGRPKSNVPTVHRGISPHIFERAIAQDLKLTKTPKEQNELSRTQ
jgi:hypothetical protein